MRRWEVVLAVAGSIFLALGARWIHQGELPRRDLLLQAGDCRLPLTILDPLSDITPAGSAIIFHGLSANRRLMLYLGQDFAGHGIRAYLPDLPGHGDSTQPFTFARDEDCADAAVAMLLRTESLDPAKTIVLGHSMGGEIAIRMADRIPVAATIAISPAPMVLPQRMPANLLVFSAQFDVWQLKNEAKSLRGAAGGDRTARIDFIQRRAFALVHIPFATHTSLLDDPAVADRAVLWAMRAIIPQADPKTLALNLDLATYGVFGHGRMRFVGAILGLVGLGLMLPLAVALAAKTARETPEPSSLRTSGWRMVLAEGMIGALLAVLVLVKVNLLGFIHLYAGDYLAAESLIMAVVLLLFNRTAARQTFSPKTRSLLSAAVLAFILLLGFGAWFNWQIGDLWLDAPRWWRFVLLLPFACIFCYAEEVVLGPAGWDRCRTTRFGVFLVLRFEIWVACVFALYALASGQILLPILLVQFGIFSVVQGLVSHDLRRRTASGTAAALFGAILTAWFLAAVFPIT